MKEVVQDYPPKRIKHLQFGVSSPAEIVKQGVLEVFGRDLYKIEDRTPSANGALDLRMGTSDKQGECATCGKKMAFCVGHFGHVKLALPAFHIGYFKHIIMILQTICKDCSCVLLAESDRRFFLKSLRRPNLDNLTRSQIAKRITDQAKKTRTCPHCGKTQGVVKKAGPLKIVHERFRHIRRSWEDEIVSFKQQFEDASESNNDLKPHLHKAFDDLNPLRVLKLFRGISLSDCELLSIDPQKGQPERFIWQYIPAPPVCIRPSVAQEGASTEDDLTVKLAEITWTSGLIKNALENGTPVVHLMEQWDYLQLLIAQYINSETPGLRNPDQTARPIRGFCQRLKGKQGRFRGNLSGKRVDFSGRTVISPDPNLRIDQVAVPERVAKLLTYPERVTQWNKSRLQQSIVNGVDQWPGANFLIYTDSHQVEQRRFLRYGNRGEIANNLRVGDVVERHLIDDDIVLFNRQPSLHKLSIMAHFVKVRPWRTFRLNECVCGSYNADFDGDEMNIHVPQTEEARTEALHLMGVKENLVTPKNGEPIVAATQDFVTGAYLISQKDRFYNRKQFTQMCCMMVDADTHIDFPKPAIVKPFELWTGKQVFGVLMRPNKQSNVLVNVEAKTRSFTKPAGVAPDLCPRDGYLIIKNSEIMCGVVDKSNVGDGKKTSIFYVILRDYGAVEAAAAMNRLAKLCARFLANQGFSIGINDVQPGERLRTKKAELISKAYAVSDEYILQLANGSIQTQPGMDQEETLEALISSTLSKVRDDCGAICMSELSNANAPLIMATSGAKGSQINVSQMVACVGQQIISGKRVPDGFQDRSLPHFAKNSKQPPSKGFVRSSFYTGLKPSEFFFHAISGREGLVDTAVKTAETGYMSRRLMKSLEDLSAQYDGTVRSANSSIVQFTYGDDGLDPTYLEGDGHPVEFVRTWKHSVNITGDKGASLLPYEILEYMSKLIDRENKSVKCSESFVDSMKTFVTESIAKRLDKLRLKHNMVSLMERPTNEEYADIDLDVYVPDETKQAVDCVLKVTKEQLKNFLGICMFKYLRAKVEPGTAVGAIGAQSIGEPGTQMTLKTFHFAGVAAMTTLGVPRIKEIINAAKVIQTPLISCKLENEEAIEFARVVKGRLEKTYLEDILSCVEEMYSREEAYLGLWIDYETISRLQLEINIQDIKYAIATAPKLKIPITQIKDTDKGDLRIYVADMEVDKENPDQYYKLQYLKRMIPRVIVKGLASTNRTVITQEGTSSQILVEGQGLKEVMNTTGVVGTQTTSNHVMETKAVLGIEAARISIIKEVEYTMASHGLDVDPRHLMLLGDVMTYKGDILGITRFGVSKMKDSVLMLASFEKTTDHLFDAAARLASDSIEGVSERIIMGIPMSIGTGMFRIVRPLAVQEETLKPKPLAFDS